MLLCLGDYPGSYVGIFIVYPGLYALVLVEFAYYYVGYSDPKSSVFMLGGLPQFLWSYRKCLPHSVCSYVGRVFLVHISLYHQLFPRGLCWCGFIRMKVYMYLHFLLWLPSFYRYMGLCVQICLSVSIPSFQFPFSHSISHFEVNYCSFPLCFPLSHFPFSLSHFPLCLLHCHSSLSQR